MKKVIVLIYLLSSIAWHNIALSQPDPFPGIDSIHELVEQVDPDRLRASDEALVGFYTRHTYSDTAADDRGIGAARRWLIEQYESVDVNAERYHWQSRWRGEPYPCYNVHATIEGDENGESIIVLGGHLDSRSVNGNNNEDYAPGANDDATGVIAELEIGRLLTEFNPRKTIILASFTGEEQGLLGSTAFANQLEDDEISVAAMLNMDMIGRILDPDGEIDSTTVRCFSAGPPGSSSRQLARYVKWIGEAYSDGITVNLIPAIDRPGRGGDHRPFSDRGYSAVRMIETAEDVAYQHNEEDVPAEISFNYAARITRLVLGVTATIASTLSAPAPPEVINSGDGRSFLIQWHDSLGRNGDEAAWIAYRQSDQGYWEDILEHPADDPPYLLEGLYPDTEYMVSLSIAGENGLPSLFSLETSAVTDSTLFPPDRFETTSTESGVSLNWELRPEININGYRIERRTDQRGFDEIAAIDPDVNFWMDENVDSREIYYYRVRSIFDDRGISEPSPVRKGALATHDNGIMVIDATPDGNTIERPDDEEVDDFYADVLARYAVNGHWDSADSSDQDIQFADADLASFELVIMHIDGYTTSPAQDTLALRKYLNNGGKLILSGLRLSRSIGGSNSLQPGFHAGDFLFDQFAIDSIHVANPGRPWMVGAAGEDEYPDLTFDVDRFPDRQGQIFADAIWNLEFPENVEVIAAFSADDEGSDFHGKPVAIKENGENPRWIIIDVPLFNMTPESAIPFLRGALEDISAPVLSVRGDNGGQRSGARLYWDQNIFGSGYKLYKFTIPVNGDVEINLYDIQGRIVENLLQGYFNSGDHNFSNLLQQKSMNLPAGIYTVNLKFNGKASDSMSIVILR